MSADARAAPGAPHPGPLAGMRVLELAQIMAGPTCGALLADLGADVVKVEKLPGGDDARGYREPRVNGVSAPFLMLNRNKRGTRARSQASRGPRDPAAARAQGRRADRELPARHDGQARPRLRRARRGESGADLLRDHGLRARRAVADKGGFDLVAQAFAGLMAITGEPGRAAGQDRQSRLRHQRRHPRRRGHPRRMGAPSAYRSRADRRHLAHGSGAAADVLARGELFRDRRVAGPARLRAHSDGAVPGVRRARRLDRHRRREPGELGAHRRRARPSRVARRSALRDEFQRGWRTCPRSSPR